MVKAYLRYEHDAALGVVTSAAALAFVGADGALLATAALETVALTDARTGARVADLTPAPSSSGAPAREVTALAAARAAAAAAPSLLAAGHADGRVRVWDVDARTCDATLAGHASAVTALAWDDGGGDGAALASGGADTDVVLWDAVAASGVARLRGHTAPVTGVAFVGGGAEGGAASAAASASPALASVARDGAVRVWHLPSRACVQTLAGVGGGGELWCASLAPGGALLAVAGTGADVALLRVAAAADAAAAAAPTLTPAGALRRAAPDRAAGLTWTVGRDGAALLAAASAGRVVDLWRARGDDAARRHAARRAKRKRDKLAKAGTGDADGDAAAVVEVVVDASDELEALAPLRLKHRARAAAFSPARARGRRAGGAAPPLARLALALANNVVEQWDVSGDAAAAPSERSAALDSGHRTGLRAVALAPDGRTALAASGDAVTLWNVDTGARLRTVDVGTTGLAAAWAPGGRHAVVGGKDGALVLVDAAAGDARPAAPDADPHAGPVWSVTPLPDGSGFVTASADKDVRFWEWELEAADDADAPAAAASTLRAVHMRTLRLADDALAARVSPDGSVVAVALLDGTVQVFHADTLKFRLALYGHALPALALDISSDGALLVSGGADRTVRVWGLDFGDCHRTLRGHTDSVMAVTFVPGTHHVFTASKDGTVRLWDADAWTHVLTLADPAAEVWSLAASPDGGTLLAGGADRALRVWRRTDEPVFVDEEAERRLETLFDAAEVAAVGAATDAAGADADGGSNGAAVRTTTDALGGADALAAALDAADDDEDARADAAAGGTPHTPSPLLLGRSPDAHVSATLASVKAGDLEAALLCAPLGNAVRLARRLAALLAEDGVGVAAAGRGADALASGELLVRAAALLVRTHAPALAGSRAARAELAALKGPLRARARAMRDRLCEAEAALWHLVRAGQAVRGGGGVAAPANMLDVLVVGAGPVGLATALFLQRAGVAVRVVDAKAAPSLDSRAAGVHARTLETLGPATAAAFIDKGVVVAHSRVWTRGGGAVTSIDLSPAAALKRYPFALALSQASQEAILRDELERTHGVRVEWGVTFAALTRGAADGDAHAECCLEGAAGAETVVAAFVVGCDGFRSAVRRAAGIEWAHTRSETTAQLFDARLERTDGDADADDAPPSSSALNVFLPASDGGGGGGGGPLFAVPLERGWFRVVAPSPPGAPPAAAPTHDEAVALFQGRTGLPSVAVAETRWRSAFRVHEAIARAYAAGRVLIAGDAAHTHSPVGGQGANTGVQDAAALAWRLAAVLRHGVPASSPLVASYSAERRAVGAAVVGATSRVTSTMLRAPPLVAAIRNAALRLIVAVPAIRNAVLARVRPALMQLSVAYARGGPLARDGRGAARFARRAPGPGARAPLQVGGLGDAVAAAWPRLLVLHFKEGAEAAVGTLPAMMVRAEGVDVAALATALGVPSRAGAPVAVVIRPDGYVGWRGDAGGVGAW